MFTELRYTLLRFRWQILGWGLGIACLGLIITGFYDTFMEQQDDFLRMIESYPPEFLAFFGADVTSMATPEGFLGMYGFSMLPVITGIFAVLAGSGLIASDEEGGQLDLILAHPNGRTAFFFARFSALCLATVMIVILGWFGFSILLGSSSLDIAPGTMALPFIPLLAQALIYGTLALLLSMILPARRLAALGAGLLMVASYFLSSLSSLNESLSYVAQFLPYAYFQGSDALNGLNLIWLLGLLAVVIVLSFLAWQLFLRRDIRVSGEGRWPLIERVRMRFGKRKEKDLVAR